MKCSCNLYVMDARDYVYTLGNVRFRDITICSVCGLQADILSKVYERLNLKNETARDILCHYRATSVDGNIFYFPIQLAFPCNTSLSHGSTYTFLRRDLQWQYFSYKYNRASRISPLNPCFIDALSFCSFSRYYSSGRMDVSRFFSFLLQDWVFHFQQDNNLHEWRRNLVTSKWIWGSIIK